MKKYTCLRCNWTWDPKVEINKPKSCPRCRSYEWERPRVRAKKSTEGLNVRG